MNASIKGSEITKRLTAELNGIQGSLKVSKVRPLVQKRQLQEYQGELLRIRCHIEDCSEAVTNRAGLGDVEVDVTMGKEHKSALLVMRERSTLVTTLDKLEGKDSKVVQQLIS